MKDPPMPNKQTDAGGFSATQCGKCCDHGSPCTLPADHLPQSRHETEHGCIFYDARKGPADGRNE